MRFECIENLVLLVVDGFNLTTTSILRLNLILKKIIVQGIKDVLVSKAQKSIKILKMYLFRNAVHIFVEAKVTLYRLGKLSTL